VSRTLDAASHVAHLVGDVQRFGFLSAASVVKRYTEIVDRAIAGAGLLAPDTGARGPAGDALLDGAIRLAEAGLTSFDTMTALLLEGLRPDPGGRAPQTVVLPAAAGGTTSLAALWLHNATDTPVRSVELHATALTSSSGAVIPAEALTLTPANVDLVAAMSHREVSVHVAVPAGQAPGHYHGLVVLSAAPQEAIALLLQVLPLDGEP
jgi:hypothetical protein